MLDSKTSASLTCYLDFEKAFDTLNHNHLAQKLSTYDKRGPCLKLLKDCLAEKKHLAAIGDI